jgi:D-3-phosphoglycerate dehydrogenase / 2-oxoglutarate reductase
MAAVGTRAGRWCLSGEPPDQTDPLIQSEQVIITPHVAFYSEESLAELNCRTAQNIVEALTRRRYAVPSPVIIGC